MKKIYTIFILLLFISPLASFAKDGNNGPKKISPDSAECYAAQKVTVCGVVYGYYYNPKINFRPNFLDMGGEYPKSTFTVLIADSDVYKFHYDPQWLVNKDVCVTGVVTVYWDKPEMIVTDPGQIGPNIHDIAKEKKHKKIKEEKKYVPINDQAVASN